MIVWEHGKYLGQTDVDAHGTWSWELGRSWSKGEHPVKVYGVDASGFQSQRTEARFTAVEPGQGVSVSAPAAPPGRDDLDGRAEHLRAGGAGTRGP